MKELFREGVNKKKTKLKQFVNLVLHHIEDNRTVVSSAVSVTDGFSVESGLHQGIRIKHQVCSGIIIAYYYCVLNCVGLTCAKSYTTEI